tara:strand:- start:90 stop:251 length:162 start_codon:yes stop_codon:yes gene_type:complete
MSALSFDYPTTKAEWREWLEDIERQLLEQGRIVDARLLKKRDQVRDIIARAVA